MKRRGIFILGLLLSIGLISCLKGGEDDIETIVEFTIYPETQSGRYLFSSIWTEALVFSDSENKEKQDAFHTIIEGIDINYERGYEYTFRAKKTVMRKNPPMDVSSTKYELLELLKKEKKITEDKTEALEITVAPEKVKFYKTFPVEYDTNGEPKILDGLLCLDNKTNVFIVMEEIKDFTYEAGYQYVLKVNKIIQATPYAVSYELIEQVSKEAK